MSILTRYIVWTILKAILLLLAIICGIFTLITLINEMQNLSGQYNALYAISYVLMILPQNLNQILPVIGFLGTLVGLNHLARHNELIAMRTAGLSLKNISFGVFCAAILMMLVSLLLGSYVGPVLEKKAQINKAMAKGNQPFLITPRSTWIKNGNDYILIGHSLADGRLADIKQFHLANNQLTRITNAKTAIFADNRWRLEQVVTTELSNTHVKQTHLKTLDLPALASPKLLKVLVSEPEQLSLLSLYQYIHYRISNHLAANQYQVQLWMILYSPLSIVLLMLISVPFVFKRGGRDHHAYKIIAGVLLCFVFFILQRFIVPFTVVYNLPPALGTAIPPLIFSLVLLVMLVSMD